MSSKPVSQLAYFFIARPAVGLLLGYGIEVRPTDVAAGSRVRRGRCPDRLRYRVCAPGVWVHHRRRHDTLALAAFALVLLAFSARRFRKDIE